MNVGADPLAGIMVLALALICAAAFLLLSRRRPWWSTVIALVSLPLVPFWIGVSVAGFFISVHMVLMVAATLATLAVDRPRMKTSIADVIVTIVLVMAWAGIPLHLTTLTQGYSFLQWMTAYWFGRVAMAAYGLPRLAKVMAAAFSIAAVALLAEFVTGVNLWITYAGMDNSLYSHWSGQQSRGGVIRAEGAFGHSIAAGCSLALAAILTLDAKLRISVRVLAVGLMCAAILSTISRTGIVTVALGIGLALIFGRTSLSVRAKLATFAVLALGSVVYALGLTGIFADAGSEASNSAAYRFWLLDLLPDLRPFGYAAGAARSTAGDLTFGNYQSVDNAVLYFALTNGWVPAALLVLLMLGAVVRMLRLRVGAATVALVATLPALFTVALITQYALVFWLVAGLAAGDRVPARALEETRESAPPPAAPPRQELVPAPS